MNLIIVDDEILTIQGIQTGVDWTRLNFENVFTAESAEEAIEYFEKYKIEVMLCDIEMDGMNGIELLEWVRDRNFGYDTECIFLTCHDEFSFAQKALQFRAENYLLKPVLYPELTDILRKVAEKLGERNESRYYEQIGKDVFLRQAVSSGSHSKSRGEIVESVVSYIRNHLGENLTAESLAKEEYISADYLYRIFKKELGKSLGEFITSERMKCARTLLADQNASVVDVALSVGFDNYSYFSRVFKQEVGMPPSAYQKKVRQKHRRE